MVSNTRGPDTLFSVLGTLGCKGGSVQQAAEFGDMRYMYSASVTDFLNRWKA